MLEKLKKNSKTLFLLFTVILTIPALFGLIHSGFPLTDDGNWMIIRLSAFYEALRSGQFPVRFLLRLNNGFGYPVADFLYPLFLYLGSLIHALGFSFVNSIKIILALSIISSAIFSYLWLRKIFNNLSAIGGALVFTLFPYHLFDIYVRGSVGEALSISIIPFILWQIEKRNILLTSFGILLLIISHNSLALFFLPLIFIYGILRNNNYFKFLLVSFTFGILGASFFWIPAFYDLQYTIFSKSQVSDFYNYFLSIKDLNLLGFIFILILVCSLVLSCKSKFWTNKFFMFSVIASLILVFLLFPFSKNLWELIPLKNLIQFPFRLISLLLVFASFQAAVILNSFVKLKQILFTVIIIVFVFVSALPFLNNIKYQDYPNAYYSTNLATTTVKNEYMPIWVKEVPLNYPNQRVVLQGPEKVNMLFRSQRKINFQTTLTQGRKIIINIIYYPGWEVYINNLKTTINYDNPNGLMTINLNKGLNNVVVVFNETPIRIFADILSIIGVIGIFLTFILIKYKKLKLI